mgnify:CR=1 FL=1
MTRQLYFRLFLYLFLSICLLVDIQICHAAEQVEVEASGNGQTKMDALQNAWMEAVRLGVGMFLTSKTESIDDTLTEKIVIHSRGQVNSFEILSENNTNDVWSITIRAKLDKDILQETVASTQSKALDFNAQDDAAQKISQEQKGKSQTEVLQASLDLFDFSKCLDYTNTLIKGHPKYKNNKKYYIQHILKMNLKKFKAQADQLEKVIASIAEKQIDVHLDIKIGKQILEAIKKEDYTDIVGSGSNINHIMGYDLPKLFVSEYIPSGMDYKEYAACFFKNVGTARCYSFGKKLGVNIPKAYTLTFKAETDDDFDSVLAQTSAVLIYPIKRYSTPPLFIGPFFKILPFGFGTTGTSLRQDVPIIECVQELNLSDEQLVNIKKIRGSYSLEPRR